MSVYEHNINFISKSVYDKKEKTIFLPGIEGDSPFILPLKYWKKHFSETLPFIRAFHYFCITDKEDENIFKQNIKEISKKQAKSYIKNSLTGNISITMKKIKNLQTFYKFFPNESLEILEELFQNDKEFFKNGIIYPSSFLLKNIDRFNLKILFQKQALTTDNIQKMEQIITQNKAWGFIQSNPNIFYKTKKIFEKQINKESEIRSYGFDSFEKITLSKASEILNDKEFLNYITSPKTFFSFNELNRILKNRNIKLNDDFIKDFSRKIYLIEGNAKDVEEFMNNFLKGRPLEEIKEYLKFVSYDYFIKRKDLTDRLKNDKNIFEYLISFPPKTNSNIYNFDFSLSINSNGYIKLNNIINVFSAKDMFSLIFKKFSFPEEYREIINLENFGFKENDFKSASFKDFFEREIFIEKYTVKKDKAFISGVFVEKFNKFLDLNFDYAELSDEKAAEIMFFDSVKKGNYLRYGRGYTFFKYFSKNITLEKFIKYYNEIKTITEQKYHPISPLKQKLKTQKIWKEYIKNLPKNQKGILILQDAIEKSLLILNPAELKRIMKKLNLKKDLDISLQK